MSDQFEESGTADSGSDAPTSQSGNQSVSSPSQNVVSEDALVDKILAKLEPRLRPMVQSIKDKRLSEFEKQIKSISEQTAKGLVESGLSEKEASEAIAQFVPAKPPVVQADNPGGNRVNASELQRAVLELAGLNESDPDIVLLSQKSTSPDQYALEVRNIVARRKNPPPMSTATQPVAGSAYKDKDALISELMELQLRDPMDRSGKVAKLKAELGFK